MNNKEKRIKATNLTAEGDEDFFDTVSATEYTGMMYSPPHSPAEEKSYQQVEHTGAPKLKGKKK